MRSPRGIRSSALKINGGQNGERMMESLWTRSITKNHLRACEERNSMDLTKRKCIPCEKKNTPPFTSEQIKAFLPHLKNKWEVEDGKKIHHEFRFKNFVRAMAFVDRIADVAETEGHHPDIHIYYDRVVIELMTHAINGLSENDFIVAAKIEEME